ncbi:low molecular weight protein-tyrosine-phosphatase [Spirochaeta lutea]|uniref:protein-tyrosine-phosphatase n=1 Tax=Spirochaeta lutea TaxID=1480694 RepID=A0A098QS49_9SPIO|nr:low molecular weight protein-tyrosine-phosphatase [Spirochaeta lutea]KGE70705.1 hypothetical protein DC28_14450 [Spirochaeta lutea]
MNHNPRAVLFVCTGNICRSPLAHALFQSKVDEQDLQADFYVESAGTHGYHIGEDADPRMRSTAAQRGVPFHHRARQFSIADFDTYHTIFVMDRGHLRHLRSLARTPADKEKIRMFREFDPQGGPDDDVPDPYYGGQAGFDLVYDITDRTTRAILEAYLDGRLA